jgi:hypothetical protein
MEPYRRTRECPHRAPIHSLPDQPHIQCVERLMRVPSRTESVRKAFEVDLYI